MTRLHVANLTYTGKVETNTSGKVLVFSNQTAGTKPSRVEVPYTAIVLHGGLNYDHRVGMFTLDAFDKDRRLFPGATFKFGPYHRLVSELRNLTLTNDFAIPVHITAVILKDPRFHLMHCDPGPSLILAPGEVWSSCQIDFRPNSVREWQALGD